MGTPENPQSSITFVISTEKRIRIACYNGIVDDRLLLDTYSRLITGQDFDPTLDDIVDLRNVSDFKITYHGIHQLAAMLAELDILGFRTRVAIVATIDVAFGLGRMYELMRDTARSATEDVCIFREYDEALRWLYDSRGKQETP